MNLIESTFVADATALTALGLSEADLPEVRAMAERLDVANPAAIFEFGREAHQHTVSFSEQLLSQARSTDIDTAGKQLAQVVVAAKSLNVNSVGGNRSRVPVIGRLIDRLAVRKTELATRFASVREQIDTLMAEVQTTQENLARRSTDMEAMANLVQDEYRALGFYVAAGALKVAEWRAAASDGSGDPLAAVRMKQQADAIDALDRRVADLRALQHAALQMLPTIRMLQASNLSLVDKFHTIRELTIPAWKRQFTLALALREQESAVKLAGAIDDATNAFMRKNAELLRTNAVATAKANQRQVIDVGTLEHVQKQLIATVQDVIAVQEHGAKERRQAEGQITDLQRDLTVRLSAARQTAAATTASH